MGRLLRYDVGPDHSFHAARDLGRAALAQVRIVGELEAYIVTP